MYVACIRVDSRSFVEFRIAGVEVKLGFCIAKTSAGGVGCDVNVASDTSGAYDTVYVGIAQVGTCKEEDEV
jgi:hypothetical protein